MPVWDGRRRGRRSESTSTAMLRAAPGSRRMRPPRPRRAPVAPDESGASQRERHLVHAGRRHPEMALHVGLGWGATMHARVGVDEGQGLALLIREARVRTGMT